MSALWEILERLVLAGVACSRYVSIVQRPKCLLSSDQSARRDPFPSGMVGDNGLSKPGY